MNDESIDIERYLSHLARIVTEDPDWTEARRAGLTEDEIFIARSGRDRADEEL